MFYHFSNKAISHKYKKIESHCHTPLVSMKCITVWHTIGTKTVHFSDFCGLSIISLKKMLKYDGSSVGMNEIQFRSYENFWSQWKSLTMMPCCEGALLLYEHFIMCIPRDCGVGTWIRWCDVGNMMDPRGECVIATRVAMNVNDFDESHHWCSMVGVTWCCSGDILSRGPYVHVV